MSELLSKGYSARDLARSPALQLAVYLLLLGILLSVLAVAFPAVRALYVPSGGGLPQVDGFEEIASTPGGWQTLSQTATEIAVLGILALLGALMFTIPIVRVYAITMRQEGYDKSFVRLLVALPVVVAGVVRIVQNDLALAFALAGIVAAVRFRTTVKDLQDASFAFAAIAIGLASGTGNLVLAGALSAIVTALAYAMWRLDVGEVGPSLELPYGGVTLSEALVPGESQGAVIWGNEDDLTRVGPADIDQLQKAIDELASYVQADALRKKKKYNTIVIAHSTEDQAKEATEHFEKVLENHATRFVRVGAIHLEDSEHVAHEYLARLKKSVDIGEMVDAFDIGPKKVLAAVELKPIGGLRDRLT